MHFEQWTYILAEDCTIQQSSNVINENRKDMNMPYCKTSEIYIIRKKCTQPNYIFQSVFVMYWIFNLVSFFFLVTGTSWEIFLCCEANGRDVDKYQCQQIHKIQGHAIGCISRKHVSVFSAAEQQSNCEDIKSSTWPSMPWFLHINLGFKCYINLSL